MMCISICFWMISWVGGVNCSLTLSRKMHDKIIQVLLTAPIDRFYDKVPVGRILNRLSTDLNDMDYNLFQKLQNTISTLLMMWVPFGFIHFVMPFAFSIATIPFYSLIFTMTRWYWNVMIPLRYLELRSRAATTGFITEVQYGSVSARAYQTCDCLAACQSVAVDQMLNAEFASGSTRRWVVNRLLVCMSFFCTCVAGLGMLGIGGVSAGAVSLCLTNVLMLITSIE